MSGSATTPARIRAAAARWVAEVAERGRSLEDLLADDADEGSARGLKRSLTYGTLRWHYRLHAILVELADRPPERLAPTLRALLEIGLYQLASGEVAEHAAVAETVGAARVLGHARATGFVNAVLPSARARRGARESRFDLATRTAHPRWLTARSSATGQASTRLFSRRTTRTCRSGCASTRGGPPSRHSPGVEAAGFSGHRTRSRPMRCVEPAADVHPAGVRRGLVSVQDAAAHLRSSCSPRCRANASSMPARRPAADLPYPERTGAAPGCSRYLRRPARARAGQPRPSGSLGDARHR